MNKGKTILIVLLLVFISMGNVFAEYGKFNGSLTVSPLQKEMIETKKSNSREAIRVGLDSNSSHTYKVQFRVLNWYTEVNMCDWVFATEGGSYVGASCIDGRQLAAGDRVYIVWKNSTLFNPSTYTVYAHITYY